MAFTAFNAIDVPDLTTELNAWGAGMEHAVTELRGAILMQGAELEAMRNGLALIEQRTEQVTQFGGKAVAELDAIMTAFRTELVMNKAERAAEGEALKGELRQLVEHLQAKFMEVEGAIRTLTETAAAAAATGPSRRDPWFQPGQPSPGQPAHFAMDVDDELSRTVSGPPGVSPSPAPPGPPGVSASPPAWGSTWQSGRPEGRNSEFKVETRNWKNASLDLEVNPEGFLAWRDRPWCC